MKKSSAMEDSCHQSNGISVPLGANAWVTEKSSSTQEIVKSNGLVNWTSSSSVFSIFFCIDTPGTLKLSLRLKVSSGESKIKVSVAGQSKEICVSGKNYHIEEVGEFNLAVTGYIKVDIQGIIKKGLYFADISDLIINGTVTKGKVTYILADENAYWSRRGPSVHLQYTMPKTEIEYFYNEVTVPTGEDPPGSYFMANGFNGGYFGIQVTETDRRVLFSIWSPYATDDPNSVPENLKVKLLNKGHDVVTGEFGNEGSGGQSYMIYNWQSGVTHKFLTRAYPDHSNTIYTSWIYLPEASNWKLVASFERPQTKTYLKGLYSFLENFLPDEGCVYRRGIYGNQWARDVTGKWHELITAQFTGDVTATKQTRLDFGGGVTGNSFYLCNCGFFCPCTPINQFFSRDCNGQEPNIDLNSLP